MTNHLTDDYIDDTLSVLKGINSDKYYVQMAVAWALCDAFIKHRDKALAVLIDNEIDKFAHNKAIQKIRESFRVSDDDKELVKTLKK